ncbi:MAG: futalosine hydrolase [Flavobacteriales bacterium]|nr:MAG: futalosine hydrolase [Flavobacteriales bacterium]
MKILIVSATYLEIEPLLLQFSFEKSINQKLKNYTYNNHQIDVLTTGIGMTSTAYWLGKTLSSKKYDVAINLGIAGSFDENLNIGQTVHVTSDRISELGSEDGKAFLSLSDMNLESKSELKNTTPIQNSVIDSLENVIAITVNTAHGNDSSIKKVKERYNPQIESMEGAAFLYVCMIEKVTCTQIRTISNKVEKRNKDNWDIPLAVKNLCSNGLGIINAL